MTRFIVLIDKYKKRIQTLQNKQKHFENTGRAGACISLQGEIQAYNAVIKDLTTLTDPNYKD